MSKDEEKTIDEKPTEIVIEPPTLEPPTLELPYKEKEPEGNAFSAGFDAGQNALRKEIISEISDWPNGLPVSALLSRIKYVLGLPEDTLNAPKSDDTEHVDGNDLGDPIACGDHCVKQDTRIHKKLSGG